MASRHEGATSGQRWLAWAFVVAQAVLIAALIFLPGNEWILPLWLPTLGRVLSLIGIAIMIVAALALGRALTPLPLPNNSGKLKTGGLYRFARHPIYTGLIVFAVGQVVSEWSVLRLASAVALIVLISVKSRWEEQRLTERFPDYSKYADTTPRFIPSPRLYRLSLKTREQDNSLAATSSQA